MKKIFLITMTLIIALTLAGNIVKAETPSPVPSGDGAVFQQNDISLEVYALQKRLFSLNYFNMHATGLYGSFTEDSIKLFQNANGGAVGGEISEDILNRLYANTALPYTKGIPAPPQTPAKLPENTRAMRQTDADALIAANQAVAVLDLYTNTTLMMVKQASGANMKMTCLGEGDVENAKKLMSYPWQKRPVLLTLDGSPVLACLEYPQKKAFEISDAFALYFIDSVSDLFGLPDAAVGKIFEQTSNQ